MTVSAFDWRLRALPAAVLFGWIAISAAPAAAQSYDAAAVANLNLQMGQLQEQMRQLAGQVQETSHQIQVLQDQLRRMQEDSEYRLQQLEKGTGRSGSTQQPGATRSASNRPAGNELTTGSVGTTVPRQGQPMQLAPAYSDASLEQLASSVAQDPSLDPGRTRVAGPGMAYGGGSAQRAPGPQVLGTVPADPTESRAGTVAGSNGDASYGGAGSYGGGGPVNLTTGLQSQGPAAYSQSQYGQGGGSLVPEPVQRVELNDGGLAPPIAQDQQSVGQPAAASTASGTQTAALTTTGGGPDKLYEQAYESYASKRYGEAEQAFKSFLAQYGSNELAGNAQYWLGETYLAQGDYKNAANEFLKGYQNYKKGRKAPDSLIGLATTLSKLGQKDQACAAFDQVSRAFPSAKEAIRRATRESKKAGCV